MMSAFLRFNIEVSLLILLIVAVRKPLRKWFGPEAAYAAWLLPLACLGAFLPGRTVQLTNAEPGPAQRLLGLTSPSTAPSGSWLVSVWCAGLIFCAVIFIIRHHRLRRLAGSLTELGGHPTAWLAQGSVGPMVMGAMAPRIILPSDFHERYSPAERQVVLAHEQAHIAAADPVRNLLFAAFRCLLWFNPLIHLAERLYRRDQEMACDARVLRLGCTNPKAYAETMLKTQVGSSPGSPLACYWPMAAAEQLHERIVTLKMKVPSRRRRALGVAGLLTAYVGSWAAAWAAQPPKVMLPRTLVAQPDWAERPTGADLMRYYPLEALKSETSGFAKIKCVVAVTGALQDCQVLAQAPEGQGFGAAALEMSHKFKMKPQVKGRPVGRAVVVVPIRFALR